MGRKRKISRRAGILVGLLIWPALLMSFSRIVHSAGIVSSEYRLKAALIYKLTRFVEWPGEVMDGSTFDICLLGRDDFGSALDALERRKVNGRPIRILRFIQSEAVSRSCRILFISDSKRPFLKAVLRILAHRPLLTMGDMEQFARKGGMIELGRGGKRLEFRINLQEATAVGLEISAPLLDLATIVETEQP